jgi:L-ascorbate metabolism protein UlaG (beta-lactamase superfamily)
MKDEPLYLRANVKLEPLVDQWYAWTHLIPPATAAKNLVNRHFRIMDSYISAPMSHARAVKSPKMLGGPFIDYEGMRVDEIQALRDRTSKERHYLVELCNALTELDEMLRLSGKGFSLQPLYKSVPAILQGYIELVYDLNNHPSYRFFEPLLYRSLYYNDSGQSLMLSLISGDDRPFILSTPRLEEPDHLHLHMAFEDPRIDELFKLKSRPREWAEIREMFDLNAKDEELLASLLTTEPPPPYVPYSGPGARWRYFGHACILVECQGMSFLLDPVLSYTYESDISRYTYLDLPEVIDYVLITHNHQDHIMFETMLQLRYRVKNIIVPRNGSGALQDPSLKLLLERVGFHNVIELTEMSELRWEGGSLLGVPFLGEHGDLEICTKLAYLIRIGPHSLLFAADSCNIEPKLYEHVHRQIGDVEVLFLGMECDGAPVSWLYGPLLSRPLDRAMDESRRFAGSNYEQAMSMVDQFSCKEVYIYAMGQEPWLNYVMSIKYTEQSRPIVESNKVIQECHRRGIIAERLFGEKEILLECVPA